VLVIAPGLTVKSRLAVLEPAGEGNYYEAFNIVPSALLDKLRQGKVLVRNWHALAWDSEEQIKKRRSVDKRGVKSDEAYAREVLGEMAAAHNLLVINDEAHHAWRVNWEAEGKYLARSRPERQRRGGHGVDRRAGPAASLARRADLLRLLRHPVCPVGQARAAKRRCSAGSSATSA
jgi:YD repeat-containing protein